MQINNLLKLGVTKMPRPDSGGKELQPSTSPPDSNVNATKSPPDIKEINQKQPEPATREVDIQKPEGQDIQPDPKREPIGPSVAQPNLVAVMLSVASPVEQTVQPITINVDTAQPPVLTDKPPVLFTGPVLPLDLPVTDTAVPVDIITEATPETGPKLGIAGSNPGEQPPVLHYNGGLHTSSDRFGIGQELESEGLDELNPTDIKWIDLHKGPPVLHNQDTGVTDTAVPVDPLDNTSDAVPVDETKIKGDGGHEGHSDLPNTLGNGPNDGSTDDKPPVLTYAGGEKPPTIDPDLGITKLTQVTAESAEVIVSVDNTDEPNKEDSTPPVDRMNAPIPSAKVDSQPVVQTNKVVQTGQVEKAANHVMRELDNMLATRKNGTMVIHLEPRDLGNIMIQVKQLSGMTTAKVTASNEDVTRELEAGKQQFLNQMNERSTKVHQFDIQSNSQGFQRERNNQDGHVSRNEWEQLRNMATSSDLPARAQARGVVNYARQTSQGVDLTI